MTSSESSNGIYSHLGDIERIVGAGLCTRCGACAVCPHDAIKWDDHYYPRIDRTRCIDCGICMAVCPAEEMSLPDMAGQVFGERADLDHPLGTIIEPFIAYAQDDVIRAIGSGGGVATQLLVYLFETGEIDGALLVGADPEHPWHSKPIIATTVEQIKACAGSRYTIVPTLMAMPELRHHPGKCFALVCLPCQTHGYRMIERVMPRLAARIVLTVGLYCGANWEIEATTSLITRLGVDLDCVAKLEYRGGDWPGAFRVTTVNGEIRTISKRIFNYLRFMYIPDRCTTCVDMAGEFSDLAIGDAWFTTREGAHPFANCSTVLARTSRGSDVVREAIRLGALGVMPAESNVFVRQHMSGINTKKLIAYQRTKTKHGPSPNYHMAIWEISSGERLGVMAYGLALRIAQVALVRWVVMAFLTSSVGVRFMKAVSRTREKLGLELV